MKILEEIFGVGFITAGLGGLIGMMFWALGGVKGIVHWSVFGTIAFMLILIAGILMGTAAGERK